LCDGHYCQQKRGHGLTQLREDTLTAPVRPAPGWWHKAECLDSGVDFEQLTDEVKALCGACLVRSECLDAALAEEKSDSPDLRFMVRGGQSPTERYRIALERGYATTVERSDLGECLDCGAALVGYHAWRATPPEQRKIWLAEGMRRLGGQGRCDSHYRKYRMDNDPVFRKRHLKQKAAASRRARAKRKLAA
jgi:hypothetical protein